MIGRGTHEGPGKGTHKGRPYGLICAGGIDQLNFAFAFGAFVVVEYPDVGGNTGVVKQLIRQSDNGFQPVVFDNPLADIAFAVACLPGKQRRAVEDNADAAAAMFAWLHLGDHVLQKQQGAVIDTRQASAETAGMAKVIVFVGDDFLGFFPVYAKGRVGEHVIKFFIP